MRILVTGANGYIGSKVVSKLIEYGNDVIAVDFNNDHIDPRAQFLKVNIFDCPNLYELSNKPDVCIHLAWRDGFIHNSLSHIMDLSFHFKMLTGLIDSGLKHLAVMGSMHEVGYYEGKIDETTHCDPKTLYGISKNALREALEFYCKEKNVVFQWLRAFYIYGDDTFGSSIFCKIRKAADERKKTFPFTSGKNKFDFISIDDLVQQIALTITQTRVNGIINVCSGKPETLGSKVEWYIKENKLDIRLDYGVFPERKSESPCIYGDCQKIEEIKRMKESKILVTGSKGQLGFDCVEELKERGYSNVLAVDRDDFDITNFEDVYDYILKYKPSIVLHNAAWTAVDKAEQYPEEVYKVNVVGTENIAKACKDINAKMVYISTDYVFDGLGEKPFEVNDEKNGLSVYGRTKSEGENRVKKILEKYFIVRISWAFGRNGNNFVKTMLKIAENGKKEVNVVSDQIGSVTYTEDLASLICDMIETEKYGIYHATNEGYISWSEFAKKIFELSNYDVKVNAITTKEYMTMYPNQATRPLNSRLSKNSLDASGFKRLPRWEDALERFLLILDQNSCK